MSNRFNQYIGKVVRRIEHDSVNYLKILFEDGTKLEFEAGTMAVGGAGTIGTIVRVTPCIPEEPGKDPFDYE